MNLAKSYEFFQPEKCRDRIHIIGCGAVGSTVAENLVRFGLTNITLYDFDIVEPHNIANQMFRQKDIGKLKTEALAEILTDINPDISDNLRLVNVGYTHQPLTGYVFLCVDNIDLRRRIAEEHKTNRMIKAMFDFRIRLEDAQHYAAKWNDQQMIQSFLDSMAFSHDEAKENNPVSACNVELSVVPVIRMICASGVDNFISHVRSEGERLRKLILIDMPAMAVDAF